jgi:hypothetical protein
MLTVQPNFTRTSNLKPVAFGSEAPAIAVDADESLLKEKADFYQRKISEFDETIRDSNAPKTLKTMAKVFKVASEGLFQGWLVAWGATKGSNVIKSAVISGANSKAFAKLKNGIVPAQEFIKKNTKVFVEQLGKVKSAKPVVKFTEKVTNLIDRLDKTPVGHYIVEGAKIIGRAIKAVAVAVQNFGKKTVAPLKKMNVDQVYDKATKITSTTLGVGAGAAGAYNAATNAEARKLAQKDNIEVNNRVDENIEEFSDDEDIENLENIEE